MKASCEYDNVDDRITDATGYKERGTVYFKASKYSLALKLYKRGLGIVEKSSFTKEEEKEATKGVRILLLLNIAACFLKLEKYDEASQRCEKVCVCVCVCIQKCVKYICILVAGDLSITLRGQSSTIICKA